jgi:hypothetical protein
MLDLIAQYLRNVRQLAKAANNASGAVAAAET